MATYKKAIVAVDVADNAIKMLMPIHRMDFLKDSEIHFLHVVPEVSYGDDLAFNVLLPSLEDRKKIEEAVLAKMKRSAEEILPFGHVGKVHYKCLFSDDAKTDYCRYVKEVDGDLAITATRNKHGIFDSSFARHVSIHSPSSVLIIRSDSEVTSNLKFKNDLKVVVGVKLDQDLSKLTGLSRLEFLREANILLLHASRVTEYGLFPELKMPFFPSAEVKVVVEQTVQEKLESRMKDFLPREFDGTCRIETVFSSSVKKIFCERVSAFNADLVIFFPEQHRHPFGGLIQYQLHHGRSNLLLVR